MTQRPGQPRFGSILTAIAISAALILLYAVMSHGA